jgi:hypothetical protein
MYKNVLLLAGLLTGLGACVTPETIRWTDANNGVVFYGERLEHTGGTSTSYYMENTTSEQRCAAAGAEGHTPTYFRLAPHEKRFIGRSAPAMVRSSLDLGRC